MVGLCRAAIAAAAFVMFVGGGPSRAAEDKPLSPQEARAFEGKTVSVTATVRTVGKFKRGTTEHHFFLVNGVSAKTFEPDTLYVTIPVTAAENFGQPDLDKLQDALFEKYRETVIVVRGVVRLEKNDDGDRSRVRIDVDDPSRITISK